MSATTKAQLLDCLRPFGQEHLIAFWDELSPEAREELAAQVAMVDFAELRRLVEGTDAAPDWRTMALQAEPPRAIRLHARSAADIDAARRRGETLLREGKVGLILVAGGQGTRLGFPHPKGMYPLGPVSGRTLFQILLDRVVALGHKYGRPLPVYLMTSPATHEETLRYFGQHGLLGLAPADFQPFCQGVMPAVDAATGRILLEAKGQLALSPDGHGGMLAALANHGCLDHAAHRQLEHLFYIQVDNPLVQTADPALLGFHLESGSEMTTQVVSKLHATEKVGNVVLLDGKTQIIEYSDLPDEAAQRRNADGSLYLWAGNIAVHVFRLDFLRQLASAPNSLPYHRALKRVPCLDESGHQVESVEPNGLKFERFIFDLLPLAESALAVEVDRAAAFVPVKNAPGATADSPEAAQLAMSTLHAGWLRAAGLPLRPDARVEIHPRWALDAEEVAARTGRLTHLDELSQSDTIYLT